nr:MAG TPA: hypothetical protein [Caudoviricetes sp.]
MVDFSDKQRAMLAKRGLAMPRRRLSHQESQGSSQRHSGVWSRQQQGRCQTVDQEACQAT